MVMSSENVESAELPRFQDEATALLRRRVLGATRRLIAERGLDVSMDDIAEAADVGRRTLFRHFGNRDDLIADAVSSALDWYDEQLDLAITSGQALEQWLHDLIQGLHSMHVAAGLGLWQLAARADSELSPQLQAINDRRRADRQRATTHIARAAWRHAGGTGRCPVVVVDACALTVSSFATRSMVRDFGRDIEQITRATVALLAALLRSEAERSALAGAGGTEVEHG
jgi:AcrR family transcriptional regulator